MSEPFYTSPAWRTLRSRVLQRDGERCSIGRLLGGDCSPIAHVHHILPRVERPDLALVEANLLTVCATHHPRLEAVRRHLLIVRGDTLPPCRHVHRYRSGREACERKRRRALAG